MESSERKQATETLYAELARLMTEYAESIKRDDFFEIKRKLLGRIRQVEKEIHDLDVKYGEERLEQQYG
jgi:hypothetical protein